jgi:hypothetical protein
MSKTGENVSNGSADEEVGIDEPAASTEVDIPQPNSVELAFLQSVATVLVGTLDNYADALRDVENTRLETTEVNAKLRASEREHEKAIAGINAETRKHEVEHRANAHVVFLNRLTSIAIVALFCMTGVFVAAVWFDHVAEILGFFGAAGALVSVFGAIRYGQSLGKE